MRLVEVEAHPVEKAIAQFSSFSSSCCCEAGARRVVTSNYFRQGTFSPLTRGYQSARVGRMDGRSV